MSYTSIDTSNGSRYAGERSRLDMVRFLYEKKPHLGSQLIWSVRPADPERDFYFTLAFQTRAIVSEVVIGKSLCEKLSCNFATPTGPCTSSTAAFNYRVGDQDVFQRACEPACFNLNSTTKVNEDGNEVPHMTRLVYNNGSCMFESSAAIFAELPIFRSNEIRETRVSDLPTGFNRTENIYANTGRGYTYNKPYCDAFFDKFDSENKICVQSIWDQILGAVIGENIIKLSRAGVQAIVNNGNTIPELNLPPPPPIDEAFKLENWLSDINESFIVPDPDANYEDFHTRVKSMNLIFDETELQKLKTSFRGYKKNRNDLSSEQRRNLEMQKSGKFLGEKMSDDEDEIDPATMWEMISASLTALLEEMLTNPIFVGSIAIDMVLSEVLTQLKKQSLRISENIMPRIALLLKNLGKPIGAKLLTNVLKCTIARTIINITMKVAGQLIVALARLVALASSIVGIVLIIISVFDIILTFWDPLGFNKKYPPGYIDELMKNADFALRQDFQMSIPRIEFDVLVSLLLTEEEIMTLSLNSFHWVLEYLDSLEVNSEGSRIDRGREVNFADVVPEELNADINVTLAQLRIYTPQDFAAFEDKHICRWRVSQGLQRVAIILVALGSVLFVLRIFLAALVIFEFAIIVFLVAAFNMEFDELIDTFTPAGFEPFFNVLKV